MNEILVSAFGPFGTFTENPSEAILRAWQPALPENWQARKIILPVSWTDAAPQLLAALRGNTRFVLCLGVADGRTIISFERLARNRNDTALADARGTKPVGEAVVPGGPESLPASLPVEDLAAALSAAGIPATISDDAGGYLCNHLSYALLHDLAQHPRACLAGFIHVPPTPHLSPAEGARALQTIVDRLLADLGDGNVHPA
ncbi:MAG: pyroglutamyl-peptidase I [Opitutales bacterium]|nr:pyroglutamyl-peptidase I [Opitutales bacterium]